MSKYLITFLFSAGSERRTNLCAIFVMKLPNLFQILKVPKNALKKPNKHLLILNTNFNIPHHVNWTERPHFNIDHVKIIDMVKLVVNVKLFLMLCFFKVRVF